MYRSSFLLVCNLRLHTRTRMSVCACIYLILPSREGCDRNVSSLKGKQLAWVEICISACVCVCVCVCVYLTPLSSAEWDSGSMTNLIKPLCVCVGGAMVGWLALSGVKLVLKSEFSFLVGCLIRVNNTGNFTMYHGFILSVTVIDTGNGVRDLSSISEPGWSRLTSC